MACRPLRATWANRCIRWALLCLALLCLAVSRPAMAQSAESVLSPGPLNKAHAKWDDSCRSCHTPFDRKAQDRLCADCHKEVARDIAAKTGFHGRMKPASCRSCHTDHRGREGVIVQLDPKEFDHRQTDYPLAGKHRGVKCDSCHQPGKAYRLAPGECVDCHRRDDVHKGSSGARCADCHTEQSWKETRFDHSKARFALTGAHVQAKCEGCHKNAAYRETPGTCVACHRGDDKHKAKFGEKCDSCHSDVRWKDVRFRHDTDTRYPLRDKHREVRCTSCHTGWLYRDAAPTTCVGCHRKDDKHKETLGTECASCHTEKGWRQVERFDHDRTAFPLVGRHTKPDCKDCHKSQVYREAPSTCVACHRKDDAHRNNLGERCGDCHTESAWTVPRFDHQRTGFALKGAHAKPSLACKACHADPRSYRGTPKVCADCHRKDDPHAQALGPTCDSCHTEQSWKVERYDHNRARFALLGAHAVVSCASCHKTQRYRETPQRCVACHQADDRHKQTLGTECADCHNARSWRLARFDHGKTRYPLDGAHAKVACAACHAQPAPAGRRIAPTPVLCVGCHLKDDAHDRGFGAQCERCHQPTRWNQVDHRGPLPAGRPS